MGTLNKENHYLNQFNYESAHSIYVSSKCKLDTDAMCTVPCSKYDNWNLKQDRFLLLLCLCVYAAWILQNWAHIL